MIDHRPSIRVELDAVRASGRWRAVAPVDPAAMCFSSNDYAGLARDPRVVAAAQAALAAHGAGASASRLMAGQLDIHAQLEAALVGFLGVEAALVFPSGYQANIGVLTALAGRDAAIYSDALNHASLIDGARLSRAAVHVYPHNDVGALERLLARDAGTGRKLIVTESVFSMDGDCAPVAALHDCAARHGAWLVVDEAHAIGVFGGGRGLCAARGAAPDVVLGTLSKALGSQGGFAACTRDVRDLLINMARTFIFSTGLAPACAGAALEAINILAAAPALAGEALERAAHFRAALRACGLEAPGEAHIVPIVLGSEAATMRAAEGCRARGVLAHGIRPPTVPPGACRLRLSVSRLHTDGQLSWAAAQIADAVREARA